MRFGRSKKQTDTFMVGDRRQLTMSYFNRYQQIVFLSENWEQKHPELLEIIEPIYKRTHLIQVEPKSLSFGVGLFHPDEAYAEKKGIKLAETLITFREVYRPRWDRQKGMLI